MVAPHIVYILRPGVQVMETIMIDGRAVSGIDF